jgi:N-acetylmuramoyl-L-alanine amidase
MMLAAFIACQIAAAATPPTTLLIRDSLRRAQVPIVASAAGPMLRADALSEILPVEIRRGAGSSYTLEVSGARLELEAGVPVVRVRDRAIQLNSAPQVSEGNLLIPLQLVSEVLPSTLPSVRWDADSAQLVLLTAPGKQRRYTVIVDAGHGGVDNGMKGPLGGGPRIYEKNITFSVANRLGQQLSSRGVDVVYTRTTDTLIALDDRGRIANRAGGILFISIHVNASSPAWKAKEQRAARGFETYFLSEARTEDARRVEQMENESIRLEGAPTASTEDPLSFILSAMTQNEHLRESSELAEIVQQRLGRIHPGPNRGVKQAGFRVLITASMPAVLVEIGFGTNTAEAAFLSNPSRQDAIASAIADAAMAYLERYEGRVKRGSGIR